MEIKDLIERLQNKPVALFSEDDKDRAYLRRLWLSDVKELVKRNLGPEYLIWNPARCSDLPGVESLAKVKAGAIMLCGPQGTGKTTAGVHVLLSICDRLCSEWQDRYACLPDASQVVMVMTAPDLFRRLGRLFSEAGDDGDVLIRQAVFAKVLMIDDLGTEGGNNDACAAFYDIVNRRYGNRSNNITILCSNIMPSEWSTYREDARFARMADRWREDDHIVVLKGESQRGR